MPAASVETTCRDLKAAFKGAACCGAEPSSPATFEASASCETSSISLSDFEVWRREEGYWFGNYTFLAATGDEYESSNWPYRYDHYFGFIHIELLGSSLKQRNVFVYPPKSNAKCAEGGITVLGAGTCGVNGNEKIFAADQAASDCYGNLAGPYAFGAYTLDTTTRVIGDDTVIYSVKLPAA